MDSRPVEGNRKFFDFKRIRYFTKDGLTQRIRFYEMFLLL